MSRSNNSRRGIKWSHAGKEYWKSRLHPNGEVLGKATKVLTHRWERHVAKRELLKEMSA